MLAALTLHQLCTPITVKLSGLEDIDREYDYVATSLGLATSFQYDFLPSDASITPKRNLNLKFSRQKPPMLFVPKVIVIRHYNYNISQYCVLCPLDLIHLINNCKIVL